MGWRTLGVILAVAIGVNTIPLGLSCSGEDAVIGIVAVSFVFTETIPVAVLKDTRFRYPVIGFWRRADTRASCQRQAEECHRG